MREIDTRTIDAGGNIAVSLYLADALGFAVKLTSPGTVAEVYVGLDADVALDAYRHPFARQTTPDLFRPEAERVLVSTPQ